MGSFNVVIMHCPVCHAVHKEQTKSGSASMKTYTILDCPVSDMCDLAGTSFICEHCGSTITIVDKKLNFKSLLQGSIHDEISIR